MILIIFIFSSFDLAAQLVMFSMHYYVNLPWIRRNQYRSTVPCLFQCISLEIRMALDLMTCYI